MFLATITSQADLIYSTGSSYIASYSRPENIPNGSPLIFPTDLRIGLLDSCPCYLIIIDNGLTLNKVFTLPVLVCYCQIFRVLCPHSASRKRSSYRQFVLYSIHPGGFTATSGIPVRSKPAYRRETSVNGFLEITHARHAESDPAVIHQSYDIALRR